MARDPQEPLRGLPPGVNPKGHITLAILPGTRYQEYMKITILVVASILLSTSAVHASSPLHCQGSISVPGGSLSGHCAGGSCNGYIPSATLTVYSNCDGGVTFDSSVSVASTFVNGSSFNAYLFSQQEQVSGTCSNGAGFSGSLSIPSAYISGSCTMNGSFSATIFGSEATLSGTCTASESDQ